MPEIEMDPPSQFITPPIAVSEGWSYYHTYHVVVDGMIVFCSRVAQKALNVAVCVRGQFWRTPVKPKYPAFCVCDFEVEQWRATAS